MSLVQKKDKSDALTNVLEAGNLAFGMVVGAEIYSLILNVDLTSNNLF